MEFGEGVNKISQHKARQATPNLFLIHFKRGHLTQFLHFLSWWAWSDSPDEVRWNPPIWLMDCSNDVFSWIAFPIFSLTSTTHVSSFTQASGLLWILLRYGHLYPQAKMTTVSFLPHKLLLVECSRHFVAFACLYMSWLCLQALTLWSKQLYLIPPPATGIYLEHSRDLT